ncbi:MAG: Ppx/GppA phosphatase family protein [Chloroflexia bacterium]
MEAPPFAVADLGSNTVGLLVARTDGRTVEPVLALSAGLRLGAELDGGGEIGPAKIAELISTVQDFKQAAEGAGAETLHLIGTYPIRMAANGEAVCEAIRAATGLPVEVLTTQQEAALAFLAASGDLPERAARAVLDIGGGSVQVVVGRGEEVGESVSLPLGATKLARQFFAAEQPTGGEVDRLAGFLADEIRPAMPGRGERPAGVVGVGGSLRKLPALLGMAFDQPMPQDAPERALKLLRALPTPELAAEYEMTPERAASLIPAVLIAREVLRAYGDPSFIVTMQGIRDGAILLLARRAMLERGAAP